MQYVKVFVNVREQAMTWDKKPVAVMREHGAVYYGIGENDAKIRFCSEFPQYASMNIHTKAYQ